MDEKSIKIVFNQLHIL